MPIFYKQGGTWKNVDAPYVKQIGEWISAEEAYVKVNGEWKLIFEAFAFDVDTVSYSSDPGAAVLQGELKEFEEFNAENIVFSDQTLEDTADVTATAVSEGNKYVAIGGSDDTCLVYQNAFSPAFGKNPDRIGRVQLLTEPSEEIGGLSFYQNNYLAVAAEQLYIYEENYKGQFEVAQTFSVSGLPTRFSDAEFNSNGQLAVGTDAELIYVYEGAPFSEVTNFDHPGGSGVITGLDWDGQEYLAAAIDSGSVRRFDTSTNSNLTNDPRPPNTGVENSAGIKDVGYSSDGRLAVTGTSEVRIYSSGLTVNNTIPGSSGGVDWDGDGKIVTATSDGFVRIYDASSGAPSEIETFDNGSPIYTSVSWDGVNEYIVAGTSDSGSGVGEVYSTGVRMFFDWSKVGANLKYRQRATGLENLGAFELRLNGLDPDQSYDFRAGGFSSGGRTVVDENVLTFTTPNVEVVTNAASSVTNDSATLEGEITTLSENVGNAEVSFKWGKDGNGYPNEVYAGSLAASNIGTFSQQIQNLDKGQTYQFKAVARYGGVTEIASSRETFTTDAVTAEFDASVSDPTNFGDVFISSPVSETTTETFVVRETSGTGSYDITGGSTSNSDFTITNSFPITVNSGSSETVSVDFSTSTDGIVYGDLTLTLNAEADKNELSVDVVGVGENTANLAVDGNPKIYSSTTDGTAYTQEIVLEEIGEDREAVIDSIVEDTDPSGTWSITNVPSQIAAGDTGSFTVEWAPTSSDPETFEFDVNYDGAGLNGETLNGSVEGEASNNVKIAVDAEANGSRNTSYEFEATPVEGLNSTKTVQFDVLGNPNGNYDVREIDILNGDVGDFTIQNAPSEVTDDDTNTSVTVSEGSPLSFDIEFAPSATGNRSADLEIDAGTSATNSPYVLPLSGEALEASEILTTDNDGNEITEIRLGEAIIGGNKDGEEATQEFEVRNATSDSVFSVSADSTTSADFEISNSIAGVSDIEQGIKKAFPEIEFVPQPGNGYTDEQVIQHDPSQDEIHEYEIDHNAAIGEDPKPIDLRGTVKVSELEYETDPELDDGITFYPDQGPDDDIDFSVGAGPGNPNSLQFKVINNNSDLSTEVSIFDAANDANDPNDLLTLNSGTTDELLNPGEEAIGEVTFSPTAPGQNPTENIDVEWDNGNQSTQITVEGVIDSIISVETVDASGGSDSDLTLDFGGVAENDSRTLEVVVAESGESEDFNITSASAVSSPYSIPSNFNGGTGDMNTSVTVKADSSETTEIQVAITDAGAPSDPDPVREDTFTFEHDAEFSVGGDLDSPVEISLTTEALNPVELEMTDADTGSTPVEYSANYEDPDGNQTTKDSTGIELAELGLDADATIREFIVTDSGDVGEFALNDDISDIDYSDYDDSSGNNNPVPGGGSIVENPVTFAPFDDSGEKSTQSYTITGTLKVRYGGPGITEESTTVGLQGEVIRPAKAEVASTEPIYVDGKTGRLDNSYTETETRENYEIKETNIKEPYTVDDTVTVKKNPGSGTQDSDAYENLTGTGPDGNLSESETIENGTTVDAGDGTTYGGDAVTGTISFTPNSGGIYNHVIQIPHNAELGDDPLEIQVNAKVTSHVTGSETLTGSLTPLGSGNVEGEATFDGVPEVCEQLRIIVENADGTDPDIAASDLVVTGTDLGGQIKSETDPANVNEYLFTFEDGVSGSVNLNFEFQVDNQAPDIEVRLEGEASGNVAGSFVDSL